MSSSKAEKGQLFIIAAPSGGGKTSLVKELLEQDPRLALSISHTTRPARPRESDGVHYYFIDETVYGEMVTAGEFLEHAKVFDYYYGTSRKSVAAQMESGYDVILEIDWQGARQVRKLFPECCSIFIIPPSLEALRTRLTRRGQDSPEVIERRMKDARAEISHWAEFEHLVVNDKFNDALADLQAIIDDHRHKRTRSVNKDHQILAEQLGKR